MCLKGCIQRQENLFGYLPAVLYRQKCNALRSRQSTEQCSARELILEPNSGGATVLVMETADMRERNNVSLVRLLEWAWFRALLG